MLKRVVHSLGLVDHSDENPRRKNKVKRKHPQQEKTKEINGVAIPQTHEAKVTNVVATQEMVDTRVITSLNEKGEVKEANELGEGKVDVKMNLLEVIEESYCYAKDFYVSKGKSTRYSRRKGIKGKKPFVPPLPKARLYLGLAWQPSLASVYELSP